MIESRYLPAADCMELLGAGGGLGETFLREAGAGKEGGGLKCPSCRQAIQRSLSPSISFFWNDSSWGEVGGGE